MRWSKGGLIYVPDGTIDWARSHAAYPTPFLLPDGTLRIYLASRDDSNVGRIGFVEVDPESPRRVLRVSRQPVLEPGPKGTFDSNGMGPSTVMEHSGRLLLYYFGFGAAEGGRYTMLAGLATGGMDGLEFTRTGDDPILLPRPDEMDLRSAPCVLRTAGGWKMWYVAGSGWTTSHGREVPTYSIHQLDSGEGHRWTGEPRAAVAPLGPDEFALGRPWVYDTPRGLRMVYSTRSHSKLYRMGVASWTESDGWTRQDAQIGLDVSPTGWDSEMVCYGVVVRTRHATFMLYNGNALGRSGVGYATLEDDEDHD